MLCLIPRTTFLSFFFLRSFFLSFLLSASSSFFPFGGCCSSFSATFSCFPFSPLVFLRFLLLSSPPPPHPPSPPPRAPSQGQLLCSFPLHANCVSTAEPSIWSSVSRHRTFGLITRKLVILYFVYIIFLNIFPLESGSVVPLCFPLIVWL